MSTSIKSTASRMRELVSSLRPGTVLRKCCVMHLGRQSAVTAALRSLIQSGHLMRLEPGFYLRTKKKFGKIA